MGTIFLVYIISRELSIEHPSVGLASLAQLFTPSHHTNTVQDSVIVLFFFAYESQPSVPPVEQKRNRLEIGTLP